MINVIMNSHTGLLMQHMLKPKSPQISQHHNHSGNKIPFVFEIVPCWEWGCYRYFVIQYAKENN